MSNQIEVAIFSFNRGDYLKNCVESVRKSMPLASINVYDDNSDCVETVSYLKTLGDMVKYTDQNLQGRHGNLYSNMQMALEHAEHTFLLFLQDDCQVIRELGENDISHIRSIFSDPEIGFLRPQLIKSSDVERWKRELRSAAGKRAYYPIDEFDQVAFGNAYCDVVLADVAKLRAKNWEFSQSERFNQSLAKTTFKHMPFMANGFVFYCPEVPSYRNKKLFLASRIAQRRLNGGISAFKMLTRSQNSSFTQRDIDRWPVAEIYLTPSNPDVAKPFLYQDYKKSKSLLLIYKLERGLFKIDRFLKSFLNIKS